MYILAICLPAKTSREFIFYELFVACLFRSDEGLKYIHAIVQAKTDVVGTLLLNVQILFIADVYDYVNKILKRLTDVCLSFIRTH